ncbi:deoxyribodipyrimidine photolyase [Roseomonas sp. BU-1]|uniref:Deoxyribodipyrimidine photolyase n=2 Tax=Falsiroseomonas selenitidurans TaxID=2716335 RepID=A0ABX1E0K0_9PROT|nr:deoxyribodipyrimidine photolyase [Falsiroseomonas selenitidurans]
MQQIKSPDRPPDWLTDRAATLRHLAGFAARMGPDYAQGRNSDLGPGAPAAVSRLSPALRHRLVTEAEVVGTALAAQGAEPASKFIEEVFWRSYWKGFLQLRPALWEDYRQGLAEDLALAARDAGLRARLAAAEAGATGIAAFDAWAAELRDHGWLHNHARMWFASIWVFTLRLPWRLGADLFLRQLRDGDAASNTLSWRWVAGLHTPGKVYVARAENIARFTGGRFNPAGQLAEDAAPPPPEPLPPPRPLPPAGPLAGRLPPGPLALLLHEDDLHPESLLPPGVRIAAIAGLASPRARSPLGCAALVERHVQACLADGLGRAAARFGVAAQPLAAAAVPGWAAAHGLPVVMAEPPMGWNPAATLLPGAILLRRDWDAACWPAATRGFFAFRERIPAWLRELAPSPPSA